ncbi:hypothetical protein B0I35DRAFT_195305 [Stachybotrys elegans]|uniref:Uncharacterized protein n=1 Tax=Stachybotrys elegans TaxID=80388 RepID=A0A8K0SD08_9HYPO|nr:hypothetical protein B0I35DRAFT_195305 [Stachybotrys elegans]
MALKKKKKGALAIVPMEEAPDAMPKPGSEIPSVAGIPIERQLVEDRIASGNEEHPTSAAKAKEAVVHESIFLPFVTQFSLLERIQKLLEQALFTYGKVSMSDMLKDKGWECAEMVHLSTWADILSERRGDINMTIDGTSYEADYDAILQAMRDIRAVLVNRAPTDTAEIRRLLHSSYQIVAMLRQTECREALALLRSRVDVKLKIAEREWRILHCRAEARLKEIRDKRAQLDQLEENSRKELAYDMKQVHKRAVDRFMDQLF